MPVEKSAGAVVFRKEKGNIYYLVLSASSGWSFPKGVIDKNEEQKEAAQREVREETGIKDIEFIPGFKESIKYFYKKAGKTIFKTVVFFLAKTKEREVRVSSEHNSYKWLPFEEAFSKITFENAKEILQKANNFLEQND